MSELPYTYTDFDGDTLLIASGRIEMHKGNRVASMDAPTGSDAVDLMQAINTASGDTGHEVVRTDEINTYRARSARGFELTREVRQLRQQLEDPRRERDDADALDAQLPDRNGDVIDDIRAALARRGDLSDEHRAFYASVLDRVEALVSERDRLRTAWESARGRAQEERITGRALAGLLAHTRRDRDERLTLAESSALARKLDDALRWGRILETQRADLRRELRAESAAPVIHMATPEGITPCGRGHRDVTVDASIIEATCVECLRTLAQAPQDDL